MNLSKLVAVLLCLALPCFHLTAGKKPLGANIRGLRDKTDKKKGNNKISSATFQRATERPTSTAPTLGPTASPSQQPTSAPSIKSPSQRPTFASSTQRPTKSPSQRPTFTPSTQSPTKSPSQRPTFTPTQRPTLLSTQWPTNAPSTQRPTLFPTQRPTHALPTKRPSIVVSPLRPAFASSTKTLSTSLSRQPSITILSPVQSITVDQKGVITIPPSSSPRPGAQKHSIMYVSSPSRAAQKPLITMTPSSSPEPYVQRSSSAMSPRNVSMSTKSPIPSPSPAYIDQKGLSFLAQSPSSTMSPSLSPKPLRTKPQSSSQSLGAKQTSSSTSMSPNPPSLSSTMPRSPSPSPDARTPSRTKPQSSSPSTASSTSMSPSPYSSMSPSPYSSMSPIPSSSASPSPSTGVSPSASHFTVSDDYTSLSSSMSPSPYSSMSPSPSSSASPSPSMSISPSVSHFTISDARTASSQPNNTLSNTENMPNVSESHTPDYSNYILIDLYLTSLTEEQRKETDKERLGKEKKNSSAVMNYCPSKYTNLSGFLSASRILNSANWNSDSNTLSAIIATLARIIGAGTQYKISGIEIVPSNAAKSRIYNNDSHRRNQRVDSMNERKLRSTRLTLELTDPKFLVEDKNCWVHIRLPLKAFAVNNNTQIGSALSSKEGRHNESIAQSVNNTSRDDNTLSSKKAWRKIRLKSAVAIERSISDGSFIDNLQFYDLIIRNISLTQQDIDSEKKSTKFTAAVWGPMRITGLAMFLTTLCFILVLAHRVKSKSREIIMTLQKESLEEVLQIH